MFHLSPFGDLWNQLVKKTSPKNFMWATKTYTVKKHVFHLLQSCFKPGRLYCWMDKMLRKLGCSTVKEWNSCGIYLISTNLTYFVHLKSSSRNTSGSMLFASQLNLFFLKPQKTWLTGWPSYFPLVPGNLAGKSYLILSGEFVYYHEKGKAGPPWGEGTIIPKGDKEGGSDNRCIGGTWRQWHRWHSHHKKHVHSCYVIWQVILPITWYHNRTHLMLHGSSWVNDQ